MLCIEPVEVWPTSEASTSVHLIMGKHFKSDSYRIISRVTMAIVHKFLKSIFYTKLIHFAIVYICCFREIMLMAVFGGHRPREQRRRLGIFFVETCFGRMLEAGRVYVWFFLQICTVVELVVYLKKIADKAKYFDRKVRGPFRYNFTSVFLH